MIPITLRDEAAASSTQLPLLLTEKQVQERFGLNNRTLRAWRLTGTGANYVKVGKSVRYLETDVLDFIQTRRRRSTSVSLAGAKPAGRA